MLTFQILDIIARDQRTLHEDEKTKEVCYDSDATDGSTWSAKQSKRKQKKQLDVSVKDQMVIHLFGKTTAGFNVRIDVTGFRPFFFIRIPNRSGRVQHIIALRDYIKSHKIDSTIFDITFEERKMFIGYTQDELFPFARITTNSINAFRKIKNLFLDQESKPALKFNKKLNGFQTAPEVYEANLDPMLRFFHLRNIQPCGWACIKHEEEIPAPMEIECHWEDIDPTQMPISAPFVVASWDIECYSATGDFPLAKKDYTKTSKELALTATSDKHAKELLISAYTQTPLPGITPINPKGRLTQETISARIQTLNLSEFVGHSGSKDKELFADLATKLNRALNDKIPLKGDPAIQIGVVLWSHGSEPERHIFAFPSISSIAGATVHSYPDERSMILGWGKWMTEVDPDILLGYNVFGFDERYVWERCQEYGICNDKGICEEEDLQGLNRLISLGGVLKSEEKFLSSSALGDNFLYMFTAQGRLQIDLYQYIRRTAVLESYKLDNVAKVYMSGKLEKIEQVSNFQYKCKVKTGVSDARVGRAIVLLDDIGEELSDKMVIKECLSDNTILIEGDVEEDWNQATKWVIVKDDVSPQEIFKFHRGTDADRAKLGAYCIQDCELVIDLYKKLEVFNTAMSMANVCTVPVSYIMTRGQGIKIESLIFRETYKRNQTIMVMPAPSQNRHNVDKYEGAIVLDPIIGLHESPVGVADFASLYPSTMISENISHDKIIWAKDYDLGGNFIGFSWGSDEYDDPSEIPSTDIEFDILKADPEDTSKHPKKARVGTRVCRYAQDALGTVPQILQMLLAARKAKRNEGAKEKDPLRAALLDAEQNAYKITANSLYGQLGSPTFKIRLQHLAASVTGYGRKQIYFAKNIIETFYGGNADSRCDVRCEAKTVYGDSVTGDTPLLIKVGQEGEAYYYEIQHLMEKYSNRIKNWHTDKEAVTKLNEMYVWTERGWTEIKKIIRHKLHKSKKLYRITTGAGYVDVTEDHSLVLSNGQEIKPSDVKIGTKLLHSLPNCTIREYSGSSHKMIEAFKMFHSLNDRKLKDTDYAIRNIEELEHPGEDAYVYDLETENHHFAVGPGALVVHNTDSLFIQFNPRNPETGEKLTGREARIATIELTAEAGELVTQALKSPHDFEFDKVFDPILLFSKKRYAGKMFENDAKPDDYVYKYMGISLKRRDNAPILKTIYGAAMKKVLEDKDVPSAYQMIRQGCLDLVEGRVPMSQLTITKSLRAEYANPNSIAHKVLANRIMERDPGNAPCAGDRIGYVYIMPPTGKEASKLQGDKIETPQFIKETGLKPNYAYYIEHQISKPVGEMFAILLEHVPGFDKRMLPANYRDMDEDAQFSVRDRIAYELLFRDILDHSKKINEKVAIKNFMNMFGGSGGTISSKITTTGTVGSLSKLPQSKKPVIKSQEQQMQLDTWFAADILLRESGKARRAAAVKAAESLQSLTDQSSSDESTTIASKTKKITTKK
jgi:DNA polymerase elongation subunit (family B)